MAPLERQTVQGPGGQVFENHGPWLSGHKQRKLCQKLRTQEARQLTQIAGIDIDPGWLSFVDYNLYQRAGSCQTQEVLQELGFLPEWVSNPEKEQPLDNPSAGLERFLHNYFAARRKSKIATKFPWTPEEAENVDQDTRKLYESHLTRINQDLYRKVISVAGAELTTIQHSLSQGNDRETFKMLFKRQERLEALIGKLIGPIDPEPASLSPEGD